MVSAELQQAAQKQRDQRAAATPVALDIATRRQRFDAAAPPVPADVTAVAVSAGGVAADWVTVPVADASIRLLYLHGGGYAIGSRHAYRRLAADISRAAGCAVLVIDYRLAPEVPFPGALEDALAALQWMRERGPDGETPARAVYIAGDSAGGGLTLATLLANRDAGGAPTNGAITVSAWTDLAITGETVSSRAQADPVISGGPEVLRQAAQGYHGAADPRSPLISPLYGDLGGLPPLLMQVGDDEVLLDDTLRVAARVREQGGDVTLSVTVGGFHIYQYFAPDAPESLQAFAQIGTFVRSRAAIQPTSAVGGATIRG